MTSGPAKLCQAMSIDRSLDGSSLKGPDLLISRRDRSVPDDEIGISPRVGVDYAGAAAHWPLRFYLKNSPFVSRTR